MLQSTSYSMFCGCCLFLGVKNAAYLELHQLDKHRFTFLSVHALTKVCFVILKKKDLHSRQKIIYL